jgi:ABC-type oligopeptide transport system substrate-binding subunit
MYGLVADGVQVAPDLSSVTIHVNPKARFNNGDPVTAADVKYSFDSMVSDKASPAYASTVSMARQAVVLDAATVRFDLAVRSRDAVYSLGTSLYIFSPKWGAGPGGKPKPFDQIINDLPITTGAYRVESTESGRQLVLVRRADYWARDEGVRRGFYNFDRIVYRYYADQAVQFEAFKAHSMDMIWETNLKRWGRQYKGSKFGPGQILTKAFPSGQGSYPRGLLLNLRKPVFQDIRVREALQLSFDFEWLNAQNFNLFARIDSAFSNSPFKAGGLPTPAELAILDPFRKQLPAAVFGPAFQNPRTDTGPDALRNNLVRATQLLADAGWKLGADDVLHDAAGHPLAFEMLNADPDIGASLEPWLANLVKLGIRATLRQVDFAVYSDRLNVFDFDIIQLNAGDFLMPSPALLRTLYASEYAAQEGSDNYGGVRDPAVDAAIHAMDQAATMEQLLDAAHALDRVLMQQRYFIPWSLRPAFNIAWWDRFGMPSRMPRYFTAITDNNNAYPWPIMTWWARPAPAGKQP